MSFVESQGFRLQKTNLYARQCRAFENYNVDSSDFRKEREITFTNYITERKNLIKRGISRLATRRNPQQPIGCEDIGEERNAGLIFGEERNAEIPFFASRSIIIR